MSSPQEESKVAAQKIQEIAKTVPDPRQTGKILFPLESILAVTLLACFAGETRAVSIAVYWRQHLAELSELFEDFPKDVPSHDTINRLLRLIDRTEFTKVLQALATPLVVQAHSRMLHIDGQAVQASKTDKAVRGRYIFNAYDSSNGLVISHLLINEKENEITRVINLLKSFDLHPGDLLTADAMNTQRKVTEFLHQRKALYCLVLKENNPKLSKEVRYLFKAAEESRIRTARSFDCDHGRIEERTVSVLPANLLSKRFLEEWAGLEGGCVIKATITVEQKNKSDLGSQETRYFISSLAFEAQKIADKALTTIRQHWTIENKLHWQLDVSFNQDRIQATNENYLTNRVTLNKIALNTLKTAQKVFRTQNQSFSVKTLQRLCSTPSGALETLAMVMDLRHLLHEVKE